MKTEEIAEKTDRILELQKQIEAINIRRAELGSVLKSTEAAAAQTSAERGALARQLRPLQNQLADCRHQFAKEIAEDKESFIILAEVSKKNNSLAKDLMKLFAAYDIFNEKLAVEIKRHYKLPESQTLGVLAKEVGASIGFIVRSNGHKYYIKESSSYRKEKKINPKELLPYRLLQYTHLGPKTEFIVKKFSVSQTGADICYISTQDVEYSKSEAAKHKNFILDNAEAYEDDLFDQASLRWRAALNDENFRAELLALSVLEDAFSMNDAFRSNPSNYGVLVVEEAGRVRYKPKLIDHTADCNNISCSYESPQDSAVSLKEKLEICVRRAKRSQHKPPISSVFFEEKASVGQDYFLESDMGRAFVRLLEGKSGKADSALIQALDKARADIIALIRELPESFVDEASKILTDYCDRAKSKIDKITDMALRNNLLNRLHP